MLCVVITVLLLRYLMCRFCSDRELDESLAQMEAQIFHDEGSYIKETPCGNVIRGFDAFHDR